MKIITFTLLCLSSVAYGQYQIELTDEAIANCPYGIEFSSITLFELSDGSTVLSLGDTITPKAGNYTLNLSGFTYWNGYRYEKKGSQRDGKYESDRKNQLLTNNLDSSMVLLNDPGFLRCQENHIEYMAEYYDLNPHKKPSYVEVVRPTIDSVRFNQIVQLVLNDVDVIAEGAMAWKGGRLTSTQLANWTKSTKNSLALIDESFEILNGYPITDYMHWKKASKYLESVDVVRGSALLLSVEKD